MPKLVSDEEQALHRIAAELGVTYQCVQQQYARAIAKLEKNPEAKALYLDMTTDLIPASSRFTEWLDTDQVASLFHCQPATVEYMRKHDIGPPHYFMTGNHRLGVGDIRYKKHEVIEWMKEYGKR